MGMAGNLPGVEVVGSMLEAEAAAAGRAAAALVAVGIELGAERVDRAELGVEAQTLEMVLLLGVQRMRELWQ
jgi:hypothetical protein